MNIIEAIKSGKRFRRKGQIDWRRQPVYEGEEYSFNLDELVADDWEVAKEKKVVVTEANIDTALYHADLHTSKVPDEPGYLQEFIKHLKKELGL